MMTHCYNYLQIYSFLFLYLRIFENLTRSSTNPNSLRRTALGIHIGILIRKPLSDIVIMSILSILSLET